MWKSLRAHPPAPPRTTIPSMPCAASPRNARRGPCARDAGNCRFEPGGAGLRVRDVWSVLPGARRRLVCCSSRDELHFKLANQEVAMARTGQWRGEGAGNLNPARSRRGQWQRARRLGAERGRTACARSLRWRFPGRGKGACGEEKPRVGSRGCALGCREGLGSAGGSPYGGLPLEPFGCPRSQVAVWSGADRAGASQGGLCVLAELWPKQSPSLLQRSPRGLPRRRGCAFSSGAAAVCCRPHRHSKLLRGAFPLRNLALPVKGGRGGTGWGACAV